MAMPTEIMMIHRRVTAYLPPCRVLLRWADRLDENRERCSVLNHPVDARDQPVVFPCLRGMTVARRMTPYMRDPRLLGCLLTLRWSFHPAAFLYDK